MQEKLACPKRYLCVFIARLVACMVLARGTIKSHPICCSIDTSLARLHLCVYYILHRQYATPIARDGRSSVQ